jgi:hypothetical protein
LTTTEEDELSFSVSGAATAFCVEPEPSCTTVLAFDVVELGEVGLEELSEGFVIAVFVDVTLSTGTLLPVDPEPTDSLAIDPPLDVLSTPLLDEALSFCPGSPTVVPLLVEPREGSTISPFLENSP